MPEVIIRHPRTEEEYAIQSGDFRRGKHYRNKDGELETYADAGFRIVMNGDGTEYHPPAEPAAAPAEKAAEKPKSGEHAPS
jgi:hypothetical protein